MTDHHDADHDHDLYKGPASTLAVSAKPPPDEVIADFSYSKPDPATFPVGGAMGYLSRNPSKRISRALCEALLARGKTVSLVGQDGGHQALRGRDGGRDDAAFYNVEADKLGAPTWLPIFLAVDFDPSSADLPTIGAYFRSALEFSRRPVGVYGGIRTLNWLAPPGGGLWLWQTRAWSSGRVHPDAVLLQEAGAPWYPIPGCPTDDNRILHPFPRWGQTAEEYDVLSPEDHAALQKIASETGAARADVESLAKTVAAIAAEVNTLRATATPVYVTDPKDPKGAVYTVGAGGHGPKVWICDGDLMGALLARFPGIAVEQWSGADLAKIPTFGPSPS